MSVLGSQVDVDIDESVPDPVPKHQGHTGTGCYKLHDHEFLRPKHRPPRQQRGGGGGQGGGGAPANIMDLPVDNGNGHQPASQLKTNSSPPAEHHTPVSQHQISSSY